MYTERFFAVVALVVSFSSVAEAVPTLSVTTTGQAGALDLDGEGSASTHIVHVADVTCSTDNPAGFSLTITSGNLSKADGETPIAFQVTTVDNGSAAPSAGDFTTPSGTNYVLSTSQAESINKDLYIKYTTLSKQDPGTYDAAMTITASDN